MTDQDFTMFTMSLTPFTTDGSVDEPAFRAHMHHLVDARNGIYVLSGGAGEGHVLTPAESRRLCEIAVEVGGGKVPVYANPRESRTATDILVHAREAASAGVDVVQFYQLDAGHGMKPTQQEQELYWSTIFDAFDHPSAISIHPGAGFMATPAYLAQLCERYPHLVAINVVALPVAYVTEVREAVPERIKLYGHITNLPTALALGCSGALQAEGNIIPRACQATLDAYLAGDIAKLAANMQFVQKFANIVNHWAPSTARWLKMAVKALELGNGVLRPPYVLPDDSELQKMKAAFDKLGVAEFEGIQRALATA